MDDRRKLLLPGAFGGAGRRISTSSKATPITTITYSENFNDIANGYTLKNDSDWSDWDIAAWGITGDILVANPTGSDGYIYTGDTRTARAASWDGGNSFNGSTGSADWYFRLKANNMDYAVGVWITDGQTTNCVRVGIIDSNNSGFRSFEFIGWSGGVNQWGVSAGSPVADTWYWHRLFLDWDNGLAKVKYWTGAIGDEPGAWNSEQSSVALPVNTCNLRVITAATNTFGQAYIDDITEIVHL